MTVEELSKKLEELETELNKAKEQLASKDGELAVAKLSGEDREVYDSLPETEQEAFRKADEPGREDILNKAREAVAKAAVVPEEIRKQFEDLNKRLQASEARASAAEAVAKKAVDDRHMEELAKKAEAEFAGLPGTPVEKANVLKSLEKLSDEERENVYKMLRAGNECLAGQTREVGKGRTTTTDLSGDAWSKIEKRSETIAKEQKISVAEATSQFLTTEEGAKLYQEYLNAK